AEDSPEGRKQADADVVLALRNGAARVRVERIDHLLARPGLALEWPKPPAASPRKPAARNGLVKVQRRPRTDKDGDEVLDSDKVTEIDFQEPTYPAPDPTAPYFEVDGRLSRMVETRDGESYVALCNFVATIIEEVTHDDGVEKSRRFSVGGHL